MVIDAESNRNGSNEEPITVYQIETKVPAKQEDDVSEVREAE